LIFKNSFFFFPFFELAGAYFPFFRRSLRPLHFFFVHSPSRVLGGRRLSFGLLSLFSSLPDRGGFSLSPYQAGLSSPVEAILGSFFFELAKFFSFAMVAV